MALTHATYDITLTNQGTHYVQNESPFKKRMWEWIPCTPKANIVKKLSICDFGN